MSRKQKLIVITLLTICTWSVVMAAIGQIAAVATLVPSLALVVQQVVQAARMDTRVAAPAAPVVFPQAADRDEERAG
jgi:hypothetical protein